MKLWILLKKVYEKAKRFFEIPHFKQYAFVMEYTAFYLVKNCDLMRNPIAKLLNWYCPSTFSVTKIFWETPVISNL